MNILLPSLSFAYLICLDTSLASPFALVVSPSFNLLLRSFFCLAENRTCALCFANAHPFGVIPSTDTSDTDALKLGTGLKPEDIRVLHIGSLFCHGKFLCH